MALRKRRCVAPVADPAPPPPPPPRPNAHIHITLGNLLSCFEDDTTGDLYLVTDVIQIVAHFLCPPILPATVPVSREEIDNILLQLDHIHPYFARMVAAMNDWHGVYGAKQHASNHDEWYKQLSSHMQCVASKLRAYSINPEKRLSVNNSTNSTDHSPVLKFFRSEQEVQNVEHDPERPPHGYIHGMDVAEDIRAIQQLGMAPQEKVGALDFFAHLSQRFEHWNGVVKAAADASPAQRSTETMYVQQDLWGDIGSLYCTYRVVYTDLQTQARYGGDNTVVVAASAPPTPANTETHHALPTPRHVTTLVEMSSPSSSATAILQTLQTVFQKHGAAAVAVKNGEDTDLYILGTPCTTTFKPRWRFTCPFCRTQSKPGVSPSSSSSSSSSSSTTCPSSSTSTLTSDIHSVPPGECASSSAMLTATTAQPMEDEAALPPVPSSRSTMTTTAQPMDTDAAAPPPLVPPTTERKARSCAEEALSWLTGYVRRAASEGEHIPESEQKDMLQRTQWSMERRRDRLARGPPTKARTVHFAGALSPPGPLSSSAMTSNATIMGARMVYVYDNKRVWHRRHQPSLLLCISRRRFGHVYFVAQQQQVASSSNKAARAPRKRKRKALELL